MQNVIRSARWRIRRLIPACGLASAGLAIVAAALLFVKGSDWIWLASAVAVTGILVFGKTRGLFWYVRGARLFRLAFRRRRDRRRPAGGRPHRGRPAPGCAPARGPRPRARV